MDTEAVRRALQQDDDLHPASTEVALADIRRRAQRAHRRGMVVGAAAVALVAVGSTGVAVLMGDGASRDRDDRVPVSPATGTGFRPADVEIGDATTWFVLGATDEVCETSGCTRLSRTTDGGVSFSPLTPPGHLAGISFESPTSGLAWSGTGELWATADGGRKWQPTPTPPNISVFDAWPTKDGFLLFVDGDGGRRLLRLADGHLVATSYLSIEHEGFATVASTSRSTYVAGRFQTGEFAEEGEAQLFLDDTRIDHPCTPRSRPEIATADATLWVLCNDGKISGLHRSADEGRTWTSSGSAPAGALLFDTPQGEAGMVLPGSASIVEPVSGQEATTPPWSGTNDVATGDGVALLAASDALLVTREPGRWEYVDGFTPSVLVPGTDIDPSRLALPDGTVPWSTRTDYAAWTPPPPEPRAPATPCTASDLTFRLFEGEVAGQKTYGTIHLRKTTDGRCTLSGHATLTGIDAAGQRVTIDTDEVDAPWARSEPLETPATIERGEQVRTTVISPSSCAGNLDGSDDNPVTDVRDVRLSLSDGSLISIDRGLRSNCRPQTTPFYRDNSPIEKPVRWEHLVASATLPNAVRAGETLVYTVTLTNRGADDVHLADATSPGSCPGFDHELRFEDMDGNEVAGPVMGDTGRLNCDADPVIDPGDSRTYEMRLEIPAGSTSAEARLLWQLVDTSPDQAGQGYVTVLPRT